MALEGDRIMTDTPQAGDREPNRPVHTIRLGRVSAAIWRNETEHGLRFSVTAERLYRDQDDRWQSTRSFRPGDLPTLIQVLQLAVADLYRRDGVPGEEEG
jgi:hypothetical protein